MQIPTKNTPFHLIETITGKTIARAESPARFREVITESDAHRYTVHDQVKGWFSPATSIFNQDHKTTLQP
jgi:hypothetical protein